MSTVIRSQKGFTLLEVMIVVTMVATISGIGFLVLRDSMIRYQARGAARQIAADLQATRLGAIKEGGGWAICFPADTFTSYAIHSDAGVDGDSCTADDPDAYKTVDLSDDYPQVTFSQNFGGDNVEFNAKGGASSGRVRVTNTAGPDLDVKVNQFTGNIRIE